MPADNEYWNQQQGPQPTQPAQVSQPEPAAQSTQSTQVLRPAQAGLSAQPAQVGKQVQQAQQGAQVQQAQQAQQAPMATGGQAQQAASCAQSAAQPATGAYPQQPAARPAYQQQSGYQPPSASIPYQQTAYAAAQQPMYPGVAYQQPPQKKSHKWIVAIVVIVCLFAFTAFCVKMCSDSVAALSYSSGSSIDGLTEDAIGVITLDGTIQYDGSACSPEGFKELLDDAAENPHVKAVVLRVNSGGGTATAGEEMAEYLRQFEKPVVVSSASINASAAYEISSQADYIYVAKSTEIGSIGTAMQLTDLSGLFEKLGISMDVIASSDSKDSTYGYRPLTKEERKYYQDMVNEINEMFIENVSVGRGMDIEAVRELATGLIFTGVASVENGLADAVGTREDAVAKAAELAGIAEYDTVDLYLTNYDISSLAALLGESRVSEQDIVDAIKDAAGASKQMMP